MSTGNPHVVPATLTARRTGLEVYPCAPAWSLWIAFLSLLCTLQMGQSQTQSGTQKTGGFELPLEDKSALGNVQPAGVALESTINPDNYFVGPSDVIAVNIWTSPPLSLPLTVTPEGSLIIPTVGEVMLRDQTLTAAKERVLREVRKKYLKAEITTTLVKPRPVVVSVSGIVLHPGIFTLNAADRANRAIEEANVLGRMETQDDLKRVHDAMSTRNIVLKHRDGSQDRVDVPKYFATHEDRWNPYLREGDQVVAPKKDQLLDVFAVYGEVNSPGRVEFIEGDSVSDAIHMVNGLTHLALGDSAIFSRLNPDDTTLSTRFIDIPEIMAGRSPNMALKSGDRIIVQRRPEPGGDFNVDIRGEVVHPGTYPITRNSTHLSEVIRQAGGIGPHAALGSAEVLRPPPMTSDIEKTRILSLRGEPSSSDSTGFSLETDLRMRSAPVNVDFERLFTLHDTTQDIILQSEDQILIPSRDLTVYVFGQVAHPGHVPVLEGRDAKYYVSSAGGFTDRANRGSLKIIKARTKQWIEPGATTIEAGDEVWVPEEPDRPFSYYMTIASQGASVLSVIIAVAVIVVQIKK